MIRIYCVVCFVAVGGMAGASAGEAVREWTSVGPGGGGHMRYPGISPHEKDLCFVACDMSGFYRSEDFGKTWRMSDQISGPSVSPVFHPSDPNVVYVCDGLSRYIEGRTITCAWRVCRSDDKGKNWKVAFEHDYKQWSSTRVSALLMDPAKPDRMWLALGGDKPAAAMVSEDAGKSWAPAGEGLPPGVRHLFLDPRSPADARVMYADADGKAFASRDGGRKWTELGTIAPLKGGVVGLYGAAGGEKPLALYALGTPRQEGDAWAGALARSKDGGSTWEDLSQKLVTAAGPKGKIVRTACMATNSAKPDFLYLAADLRNEVGDYWDDVYVSYDGGDTWTFAFPGPKILALWRKRYEEWDMSFFSPSWLDRQFNWGWGGTSRYMTVCDSDPGRFLRTDSGRLMGTRDGGKTWQQFYSNDCGDGRWSSRGLEVTTCYRVVFDPIEAGRQWITYTDIGCFRSDDGGGTWRYAMGGAKYTNTMYELRPDPEVPNRVFGVCSNTHDLPHWGYITRDPAKFTGGFCVSEDGGLTWKMQGEGLPDSACCALELDPKSPKESRTLYLVAFGRGVYKSADGGKTWAPKVKGMEGFFEKNQNLWTISRGKDGVLYAAVTKWVRIEKGKRDSRGGALFRSDDDGENWARIGPQMPDELSGVQNDFSNIWDVQVSPHDPNEVCVAAQIDVHSGTSAPGGVYRSRDRGKTWARIFDNATCQRIDYHPADPKRLFCGTGNDGLFRSHDGGAAWSKVEGVPFRCVYRTTVDPRRPDILWVATFGGGIWKGPAD